jgi:hypothetical protein
MPKLSLPTPRTPNVGEPITQSRRLVLPCRILTDDSPPMRYRVASCLMLLYAQPASRIVRLSIDDIMRDDDGQVRNRRARPLSCEHVLFRCDRKPDATAVARRQAP